ncbi:hypothetical protein AG4045_027431 [Apium graveolens]|uniref:SPX domain-containing protein n=1 Tax=Apium graveolens TaxID=4045 RepID=A0A6L5B7S3_APIGR|nr:hypothetical protein AG4045_027431 [Apium graveolens]
MKFGKELVSQMVPEWEEAYMNYNYLKSILKDINHFRNRNKPPPPAAAVTTNNPAGLKRRLTLYRAFSGLIQRTSSSKISSPGPMQDVESQPILVSSVNRSDGQEGYETRFLMSADEGGEYELVFFRRLDDEFNKVNKFYKAKVAEVMKEADLLNKQMNALIAFRIKVDNPQYDCPDDAIEMNRLASEVEASSVAAALSASNPDTMREKKATHMDVIDEDRSNRGELSKEDNEDNNDVVPLSSSAGENIRNRPVIKSDGSCRPPPLEILDRVTIRHPVETPRSTIKGLLNVPIQTELKFNRENMSKIEDQLKRAFVEFHNKLRLLKSYSFLNLTAFSKIMKKYDKITSRNASTSYLKMIDNSYLGNSDECLRRFFDEKDNMQGLNGLKYFATIVAVTTRAAYSLDKSISWKVVAIMTSAIAAISGTYWDLVYDWGLLDRKSKNRWLRDKLLVPHKNVYYVAMVLNVVLRLAWLQTVLDINFTFLHRETLITVVASLEIIRRGVWNFFRLENEQLNNSEKYRAFKSVPLPFHYDEGKD